MIGFFSLSSSRSLELDRVVWYLTERYVYFKIAFTVLNFLFRTYFFPSFPFIHAKEFWVQGLGAAVAIHLIVKYLSKTRSFAE